VERDRVVRAVPLAVEVSSRPPGSLEASSNADHGTVAARGLRMLDAARFSGEREALVNDDPTTIDRGETSDSEAFFLSIVTGDTSYDVALDPGTYVIGRGREAAIRVDRPGVSRAHIRLIVSDGQVILEDLGSANGTRIAGRQIASRARMLFSVGTTMEIDDAVVHLRSRKAS
jgi:hypothetical protein